MALFGQTIGRIASISSTIGARRDGRHHRANRGRFNAAYMHSCMSRENLTVNAHRCSASHNQTGRSTDHGGVKGQRAGRFCMQVHFRFSDCPADDSHAATETEGKREERERESRAGRKTFLWDSGRQFGISLLLFPSSRKNIFLI